MPIFAQRGVATPSPQAESGGNLLMRPDRGRAGERRRAMREPRRLQRAGMCQPQGLVTSMLASCSQGLEGPPGWGSSPRGCQVPAARQRVPRFKHQRQVPSGTQTLCTLLCPGEGQPPGQQQVGLTPRSKRSSAETRPCLGWVAAVCPDVPSLCQHNPSCPLAQPPQCPFLAPSSHLAQYLTRCHSRPLLRAKEDEAGMPGAPRAWRGRGALSPAPLPKALRDSHPQAAPGATG